MSIRIQVNSKLTKKTNLKDVTTCLQATTSKLCRRHEKQPSIPTSTNEFNGTVARPGSSRTLEQTKLPKIKNMKKHKYAAGCASASCCSGFKKENLNKGLAKPCSD